MGGVYTRKIRNNDEILGYGAVNAATGEERPFLRKNNEDGGLRVGSFSIDSAGLEFGQKAIERALNANLLIIDEIGKLELEGGGWYDELNALPLEKAVYRVVGTLEFVDDVIHKWNLYPSAIYNVSESNARLIHWQVKSPLILTKRIKSTVLAKVRIRLAPLSLSSFIVKDVF